jgi:hypothetical protein
MVVNILQEVPTLLALLTFFSLFKLSVGIFELVDHLSVPAHLFTQFFVLCEAGIIGDAACGLPQA